MSNDNLELRDADRTVIVYTARDADSRAVIDMSGATARARQVIFTDPANPLTSAVVTKSIDENADPNNGQITNGAGGVFQFVYTITDLAALTEADAKTYFFATKAWDVLGDPWTGEDGEAGILPQLVSNAA